MGFEMLWSYKEVSDTDLRIPLLCLKSTRGLRLY